MGGTRALHLLANFELLLARFAVVAEEIARRLGTQTPQERREAVEECRDNNMYLNGYECCEDTCGDVC